MTLRRFVRVTFDNFRQLLQTIAAPTTSLPMPQIVPLPAASSFPAGSASTNGAHLVEARGSVASAFGGDTVGGDTLGGDTLGGDTLGSDTLGGDTLGGEQFGDAQAGDEQVGDTRFGDDALGEQTAGGDSAGGAAAGAATEGAAGGETEPAIEAADAAGDHNAAVDRQAEQDAARLPLTAALESLLFVCDEAAEPARLAQALGIAPAEAEAALLALDAAYRQERRGLRLQVRNGRYQLVTAPEAANLIENFLNLDASTRLSAPALETLAVVAYRQPVTRAQIEAVRGVDCSGVLRSLLSRGLLEEVGRLDAPGRPVLYGVTDLFMHHFGLTALHELPPLDDAELARIAEAGA